MINNRINENYIMRLFSTTKKYSLIDKQVPKIVVPGLPTYTSGGDLKFLNYQIVETSDTDVTIRITELFDTTPTPGSLSIRDEYETFEASTFANISDLDIISGADPNGILEVVFPQSIRFSYVFSVQRNAVENTYLVINAGFAGT